MEKVHADFAGLLNGLMYLIFVDSYSKWPEVIEMKSTTAEATKTALSGIFNRFEYPQTLATDNDRSLLRRISRSTACRMEFDT
ncbi:hypothetical protein QR680_012675 [Steinernema hermaphroditum]|uniref:Integrase catalytic domain-containing protein n=1 Tax=Steinernema hermaphroditum TaxID=289476 RepID=A0AA39I5J9_9BILA|nr:hypothetical protein QR680_012675 [Steinernema hermaphroditum]